MAIVAMLITAAIWMLGMSLKTWVDYNNAPKSWVPVTQGQGYPGRWFRTVDRNGYVSTWDDAYRPPRPIQFTPTLTKIICGAVIIALVMMICSVRLAVRNKVTFYNSYWDMFGGLIIFIVPWAILHMWNASHHFDQMLQGYQMTLSAIQLRVYWAMTLVTAIVYHSLQTIRYNSMDFEWDDRVIASIFVFVGRIVLGYVEPVFFLMMALSHPGERQKDESPLDYKIRCAVGTAEKIAITWAAIFFLNRLVNGRYMREDRKETEEMRQCGLLPAK